MMRINLLPHRAEKRKARQIQFVAFSIISLLLGAAVVGFVHTYISTQISYQERRNQYLKKETEILDKQIAEIKKLREQTQSLLERKTIVENLQATRFDAVHLMDQMLRILPDGVYLKSLKQTGNKIILAGFAQSNARVSTLMRSIEKSPCRLMENSCLESPSLVEIHASGSGNARTNEFTLNFSLKKQAPATPDAPARTAGKKG